MLASLLTVAALMLGTLVGPAAPAPTCTPHQVLGLTDWKITLPTGKPTFVRANTLAANEWFRPTPGCDGVVFRAPVNGAHTPNSRYARSELREAPGGREASWSTSSPRRFAFTEAFTRLPTGRPHLVSAQVHDADSDVTMFRLEGNQLWVTETGTSHWALADGNYRLGTRFTGVFEVGGGQIRVFYNGRLITTVSSPGSGHYFKAGAYVQANCSNGSPCSSANYGEVVLYSLTGAPSSPLPAAPAPGGVTAWPAVLAEILRLLSLLR